MGQVLMVSIVAQAIGTVNSSLVEAIVAARQGFVVGHSSAGHRRKMDA
jgi:hypothetical protein